MVHRGSSSLGRHQVAADHRPAAQTDIAQTGLCIEVCVSCMHLACGVEMLPTWMVRTSLYVYFFYKYETSQISQRNHALIVHKSYTSTPLIFGTDIHISFLAVGRRYHSFIKITPFFSILFSTLLSSVLHPPFSPKLETLESLGCSFISRLNLHKTIRPRDLLWISLYFEIWNHTSPSSTSAKNKNTLHNAWYTLQVHRDPWSQGLSTYVWRRRPPRGCPRRPWSNHQQPSPFLYTNIIKTRKIPVSEELDIPDAALETVEQYPRATPPALLSTYTPACNTIFHFTICLRHIFRLGWTILEHFLPCENESKKKQKTKIANDFILRIHDSTIGVESVFRARGTVTWTENCGLQMRLRIGMIRNDVRDDVTLLFGCYQAFGLGLLLICFAGTGLVDKGTGFCPALTIWSCLGFGFGSGLVLWHMYRN